MSSDLRDMITEATHEVIGGINADLLRYAAGLTLAVHQLAQEIHQVRMSQRRYLHALAEADRHACVQHESQLDQMLADVFGLRGCPQCGESDPDDFDQETHSGHVSHLCYVCGWHGLEKATTLDAHPCPDGWHSASHELCSRCPTCNELDRHPLVVHYDGGCGLSNRELEQHSREALEIEIRIPAE